MRDLFKQRRDDDAIIQRWIKEGWGAPNWTDLLEKKTLVKNEQGKAEEKNVFPGRRQLSEFLKRNTASIKRVEISHKDVQYVLTQQLEDLSKNYKNLKKTIDLFAQRVDLLSGMSEIDRRTKTKELLELVSLNLMMNVEFYCNKVSDKGLDMADFFFTEYIKGIGLALRRLKREHEKSLSSAFDSYKKQAQERHNA